VKEQALLTMLELGVEEEAGWRGCEEQELAL